MKFRRIKRWAACSLTLFVIFGSVVVSAESQKGKNEMTVTSGKEVSIEYTLKLEDREAIDSNVGSEPLTFIHGDHKILPVLENALEGMKIGDSKQVTVKPEEGYGTVNQDAFQEVKKEQIPQDALKVGALIQVRDPNGKTFNSRVVEIKDQTVVLDFNHPLAGETLYFEVKVLNIKDTKI
jgi:FKBP-type peptidyl-prolyl cis-trans isomerase SlyD